MYSTFPLICDSFSQVTLNQLTWRNTNFNSSFKVRKFSKFLQFRRQILKFLFRFGHRICGLSLLQVWAGWCAMVFPMWPKQRTLISNRVCSSPMSLLFVLFPLSFAFSLLGFPAFSALCLSVQPCAVVRVLFSYSLICPSYWFAQRS